MKKYFKILTLFVVVALCIGMLMACGDDDKTPSNSDGNTECSHSYGEWKTVKDATCTENGSKKRVCSLCGNEETETVQAVGHSYGEWATVKDATCTENGSKKRVCGSCGNEETETVQASGHNFSQCVCTNCGKIAHTLNDDCLCTVCGKTLHGVKKNGAYCRHTEDGKDYIYFGYYPQTIKVDGITVGDTADSDGYYMGSDGERYAKVTATPSSRCIFSNNVDVISGTVYYFKVEPIKWRILEKKGGTAFILCDSIIANHRYAESSNNYADSEIRHWLNDEFYNKAFNSMQQELIRITNVDNSVSSTGYVSNQYVCENTNDKVFLLSHKEVTNNRLYGFSSNDGEDIARSKITSDYSRATGVYMYTDSSYYGNGFWWLRSPYYGYGDHALAAYFSGDANHYNYVYMTDYGVAPALVMRLA